MRNIIQLAFGTKRPDADQIEVAWSLVQEYATCKGMVVRTARSRKRLSTEVKSAQEMIRSSQNMARSVFDENTSFFSISFENGLLDIRPSGYFYGWVCSIYDGKKNYEGFSELYAISDSMAECVLDQGYEVEEAFRKMFLCPPRGKDFVKYLTKKLCTRRDHIQSALRSAMAQVTYAEIFAPHVRHE